MKVVLRSDVPDVGNKGDIVDVSPGFARNYLVRRGLGMPASSGAVQQAEAMKRARSKRDQRERESAEQVSTMITRSPLTISARAGDDGRLFGSVTTANIADAIETQYGVEIDRRKIRLDEPIKTLGRHDVPVRLHPDVEATVAVEVTVD